MWICCSLVNGVTLHARMWTVEVFLSPNTTSYWSISTLQLLQWWILSNSICHRPYLIEALILERLDAICRQFILGLSKGPHACTFLVYHIFCRVHPQYTTLRLAVRCHCNFLFWSLRDLDWSTMLMFNATAIGSSQKTISSYNLASSCTLFVSHAKIQVDRNENWLWKLGRKCRTPGTSFGPKGFCATWGYYQ